MTANVGNWVSCIAYVAAQVATPALAQPVQVAPTLPVQTGSQIRPVRPVVSVPPIRSGGPQIQLPRPVVPDQPGDSQIQPPHKMRPMPPGLLGGPQIQPPRPARLLPPVQPGGPHIQPPVQVGAVFAGIIRCESRNNRYVTCSAPRTDRIQLVRRLAELCLQNRSWDYNRDRIWVSNGCRAEFGYGYANSPYPQPLPDRDRGPSAEAIIAGVAVADGLIALLASRNKNKRAGLTTSLAPGPATYAAGPPAAVSADLSGLPSAARSSIQNCLFEVARQIGVTRGTRLRFDRSLSLEPGNGGWPICAAMTATYPDEERSLEMYCRATPEKVV